MTHTPAHIANYFISKAEEDGRSLTPLKLLKIVYISYGWWMAVSEEKLFDEPIEAWKHGPVVPSLYHEFKRFGRSEITRKAVNTSFENSDCMEITTEEPHIDFSQNQDLKTVLAKVWDIYGDTDGWTLRNMTHETDTPWFKTWEKSGQGAALSDDDIKQYYQNKIDSYINESRA